tara:strand:+ start:253 stop:567 length:315 start_codon:yes stop_codon:yes gene_type:complete
MGGTLELICGYVGSTMLVFLLIPQIKHILHTKDASGTTWGFIGIEIVISSTYVVYGLSLEALPIILSNSIILLESFVVVWLKILYAEKPPSLPQATTKDEQNTL